MTSPESGRTYLVHNKATGYALAAHLNDDPALTVYADAYTPWDPRQTWQLAVTPAGTVTFSHPHTGRLLDTNDQRLVLSEPTGGRSQQWLLKGDGDGYWTIHNLATGLALDSNPDREVHATTAEAGPSQRWTFVWI